MLLKSPISATMRLSEVNFCASAAASFGSARLSPTSITMGRPLTPPAALIHSTPRSMAFWKSCPYSAKLPVSGALSAIWMGSALHAAPGSDEQDWHSQEHADSEGPEGSFHSASSYISVDG